MKVMLKSAGPRTDAPPATGAPAAAATPTPTPSAVPQAAQVPAPAPVAQAPSAASIPQAAPVPQPAAAPVPQTMTAPPVAAVPPPAQAAPTPQPAAPAPEPVVMTAPQPPPAQQSAPVAQAPMTVLTPTVVTPEDEQEAREARALAAPVKSIFSGGGGMEGEWGKQNLILPRLQIVQGNGVLSTRYPGGTTIIGDETFLNPPNAQSPAIPINFVPITLEKRYREVVEQNSGLRPRTANTAAEVRALGGTLEWGPGNTKPTWNETARAVLLVQAPNGVEHSAFSEVEGLPGKWAVLLYYAAGVSMKVFANVIASAAASTLRVPTNVPGKSVEYLPKRWWRLTIEPRPWGKFNPYAVVAKQTTVDTDDVVRAYCNGYATKKIEDADGE